MTLGEGSTRGLEGGFYGSWERGKRAALFVEAGI